MFVVFPQCFVFSLYMWNQGSRPTVIQYIYIAVIHSSVIIRDLYIYLNKHFISFLNWTCRYMITHRARHGFYFSDVECFLKMLLHDLYKTESFNVLDSPGSSSRLLLSLDDWEHFNTVLYQDRVKLGDVLLPLHGQAGLHLQQSRDGRGADY